MTALSLYAMDKNRGRDVPAKGPGGVSTQFALSGVKTPGVYTLSSLRALPAVQLTATYTASRNPVTDTYTGVSVWTLLNQAGLIPDPNIKNLHASSSRATPRADVTSPTWSHLRFHRGARSGACDPGVADCATAPPGVFGEPPAHVRERASGD